MKKLKRLIIGILYITITACVMKRTLNIDSSKNAVDNKDYSASITPSDCFYASGCESFNLFIKNKTTKDIELNWNKTYYIEDGQTSGYFYFKEIKFSDKDKPKPSNIIFSNSSLSKKIWPSNLAKYDPNKISLDLSNIRHRYMPIKQNGIYLTLNVNGKKRTEKLLISFSVIKEKR